MKSISFMTLAAMAILTLTACEPAPAPTMQASAGSPPAAEQKAATSAPQGGVQAANVAVMLPASKPTEKDLDRHSTSANESATERSLSLRRAFNDGGEEYPFTLEVEGDTATYAEPAPYGHSYTRVVETDGNDLIMEVGPYEFGQYRYTDVVVRVEGYDPNTQTCDRVVWTGREILGQRTTYTASCG